MKELDKTKAYDLRDLNDEQRKELLNYMRSNFEKWKGASQIVTHYFIYKDDNWWQCSPSYAKYRELTNALTLFEPQLKVGDTFEKDGFICEVKEPIKKWVYNTYQKSYYKTSSNHETEIEITDQEFIKQLEKHAI